jgi:hypothetical protein
MSLVLSREALQGEGPGVGLEAALEVPSLDRLLAGRAESPITECNEDAVAMLPPAVDLPAGTGGPGDPFEFFGSVGSPSSGGVPGLSHKIVVDCCETLIRSSNPCALPEE